MAGPAESSEYARDESAAQWVETGKLTPWARNPRKNDESVQRVAESIKRFGFGAPILARRADGEVIAGHTRLKAAVLLGLPRVPVRYLDLDPADAHLLALADNRLGEFAEWDQPALQEILGEYSFDAAAAAGWTSADIEKMASELLADSPGPGETTEDEAPEPPKTPVTKPGDVWSLGDHRLACGDCASELVATLGGSLAEMVFTDPPYGVSYVGRTSKSLTIENDAPAEFQAVLDRAFAALLTAVAPGGAWYVCAPSGPDSLVFGQKLRDLGVLRQRLVWVKDRFVLGRSDFHYRHEDIYYGWSPGAAHRFRGDRTQDSVWEVDRPSRNDVHPTMKPVALVAKALGMSSSVGDIVVDPFLGSGTTLIAAEQLSRRCRGTELSPAYCDVIVERWQNLTGGKATRP